jgi:hypothetical protein
MLADYRSGTEAPLHAHRLRFEGVDDLDVYNVSGVFTEAPGQAGGRDLIAGRVEARDSEHSVVVVFAKDDDDSWRPLPGAARLALQDPFVFVHAGSRYLGGVEISEQTADGKPVLHWRTIIYDHRDVSAPVVVFEGPWGMKDLRFVDVADGRLGVFTRPQGGDDGRGRIGFTIVDSIGALTLGDIDAAPRFEDLFVAEEWGGVNHAWLRSDGMIGLLGHIACFDDAGDRHYYPMTFAVDPVTREYTAPRMLFERRDLPPGASKRPDLADVVFPGWVDVNAPEPVVYCGVGDAEAYRVTVPML